jgi:hypothetical protein
MSDTYYVNESWDMGGRSYITKGGERVSLNTVLDELNTLRAELEGLQSLITECTDNGELDSRLFESYIGHVTGKAHPAPVVPEGWVLVPIEPTQKMIDEARYSRTCWVFGKDDSESIYKAMLSAAKEAL